MAELLSIDIEEVGRAVIVHAKGEIDMATAPVVTAQLDEAIRLAAGAIPMIVDLLGVQFIGSAGLALLVQYETRCRERGVRFLVVVAGGPVRRVLRVSGLDQSLDLHRTVADALSSLETP
jgi:anti-sigma B factor antagonist